MPSSCATASALTSGCAGAAVNRKNVSPATYISEKEVHTRGIVVWEFGLRRLEACPKVVGLELEKIVGR